MPSNFEVSKLAEALSRVNDAGAALIEDCTSRAKDGKVTGATIDGLTRALADTWQVIAPREEAAGDTDPYLEAEEKKLKGGSPAQEVARGDRKKANDGVIHNVHDIFLSGETSRAAADHSIDAIFGDSKHDDEGSPIAPTLGDIFGGSPPVLAKG